MRIVVIAKFVPWPPNSGDKQRTLAVVRAMHELGDVTLCAFASDDEDPEELRQQGVDVRSVPLRRGLAQLAEGLLRGRSMTAARFWDRRLARVVRVALNETCDVLVLEHVQSAMYAPADLAALRVVDMHNVESALAKRVGDSARGLRRWIWLAEARLLRRAERRVRDDDVVAVVSDTDRDTLAEVSAHPDVLVAGNGWGRVEPLPATTAHTVSLVALLSWGPNVAAAEWFCQEVWPLVLTQLPDARLQLVGRNPTESVQALADDSVVVTGTVPDLEPWYSRSMVCVAPLLAGGGSRLKILEALAFGRPVVATSIGVEGLDDLVGHGVRVADEPAAMAKVLTELLLDPEGTAELGLSGARAVSASHSWEATLKPLTSAIAQRRARDPGSA